MMNKKETKMKSDVIHCKNCEIIVLDGKVIETRPECYIKFFRGNSVTNELVEKILNLDKALKLAVKNELLHYDDIEPQDVENICEYNVCFWKQLAKQQAKETK